MKSRLLNSKRTAWLIAVTVLIIIIVIIKAQFAQEENMRISETHNNVSAIGEVIINSIVLSMNLRSPNTESILAKAKKIPNVTEVKIIPVNAQKMKSDNNFDDVERNVVASKIPFAGEESFNNQNIYRIVRPMLAENSCLNCHKTQLGSVLALVSIRYSMSEFNSFISTQHLGVMIFILSMILISFFVIRFYIKNKITNDLLNPIPVSEMITEEEIDRKIESLETLTIKLQSSLRHFKPVRQVKS